VELVAGEVEADQVLENGEGSGKAGRMTIRAAIDGGARCLVMGATDETDVSVVYNHETMRVLRFRYQPGRLYLETSPLGQPGTFSVYRSFSASDLPIDLTAVQVVRGAEVTQVTSADPGDVIMGDPNGATAGPPSDTFPETDADINVYPGDDLAAIYNSAASSTDIFLHRNLDGSVADYDVAVDLTGNDSVTLRSHAPFLTLFDPDRMVYAIQPWVRIRSTAFNIFNWMETDGAVLYGLELDGSALTFDLTNATTRNLTGNGILRGSNAHVSYCRIHSAPKAGISGAGTDGSVYEFCEIDNNATSQYSGISAGIKTTGHNITVRSCYVHHNHLYGVWSDCQQSGWTIVDNWFVENFATGLFYEICVGPALIAGNYFRGNNTGGVAGRHNVVITSSKNVTFDGNVIDGGEIRIWEDYRAGNNVEGDSNWWGPVEEGGIGVPSSPPGLTFPPDSCKEGHRLD